MHSWADVRVQRVEVGLEVHLRLLWGLMMMMMMLLLMIVLWCVVAWHDGHVRVGVGHSNRHVKLVQHFFTILLDFGPAILEPVLQGRG